MRDINPFREPLDFYPTPPEGTRALLSVESFDGTIWEPACGDGAIAKVLTKAGYRVTGTDLVNRGYGTGGINFLTESEPRAKHIVTNPPYIAGLADRFILQALRFTQHTGGTVAMLLDLAGLAHPNRHQFYVRNPPSNIYVLDELICLPGGRPRVTTASTRFAWLVWKPGHEGRSTLWWLAATKFKSPGDSKGLP